MDADGDGGGPHPSGYDGRSDNRQLVTGWAPGNPPPGIPTGFCPKARGCAAEALHRVYAPHINNPEGVVPWHHRARLVADARNRKNGQRHHGFSMSQPILCVVIHTFVASAQPRCGCCTPPKPTRGCAAEALPRVNAQHISNPEGVVPWHHRARLVADARNRKNGQRHHGFSLSQPTLCVVIHTFVASAQPRCGCCAPPKRTRGSAENRATPGFGAEHLRRSQWGGKKVRRIEITGPGLESRVFVDGAPAERLDG